LAAADPRAPIGVFDSGMGGLTVLKALQARMPAESFLYLGDTARLPYGSKSPETVQRYALQAAQILVDRGVRALVVACNTASAFALDALRVRFPTLPVFGVVEPGAEATSADPPSGVVLVLATESTVASGAYQTEILSRRADLRVHARPCPLLVALAEEGIHQGALCESILRHYLHGFVGDGIATPPSTLLLGCTHFPVFREALGRLLDAPGIRIVDSAETTARVVADALVGPAGNTVSTVGEIELLATDGVSRFRRVGGYFLGTDIDSVELVDL
jgi:glutamate racemase